MRILLCPFLCMFLLISLSWLLLLLKLLPSHFWSSSLYSLNSNYSATSPHISKMLVTFFSSLAEQINRLFHFKADWMWLHVKEALGVLHGNRSLTLHSYQNMIYQVPEIPVQERLKREPLFNSNSVWVTKWNLEVKVVYLILNSLLSLSLNFCLSVYIAVFITHQFLCITCEFYVFCFYYVNTIINKVIYKSKIC